MNGYLIIRWGPPSCASLTWVPRLLFCPNMGFYLAILPIQFMNNGHSIPIMAGKVKPNFNFLKAVRDFIRKKKNQKIIIDVTQI